MRIFPILLSVSGLAAAGLAVMLAQGALGPQNTASAAPVAVPEGPAQVVLIAAAQDIRFGDPITREMLLPQTWPADLAPEGAFDSATTLLGPEGTAPRRATQTIREGELILSENASNFGAVVTIGSSLAPGLRAVAIRVNTESAVGGLVTPGDRVDIVLTQGDGATLRTGTILQDIRVLAIDQDTASRGAANARTMTVEVSPRDSQRLVLAQQAGQLSITLRNADSDLFVDAPEQITMMDVWGDEEVAPAPAPAPVVVVDDSTTIRVRRGTETENIVFSQ